MRSASLLRLPLQGGVDDDVDLSIRSELARLSAEHPPYDGVASFVDGGMATVLPTAAHETCRRRSAQLGEVLRQPNR